MTSGGFPLGLAGVGRCELRGSDAYAASRAHSHPVGRRRTDLPQAHREEVNELTPDPDADPAELQSAVAA